MKYCIYCGTVLPNGAVSFCPECGHALPGATKKEERKSEKRDYENREKVSEKEKKKQEEIHVISESYIYEDEIQPENDGYDGYYDGIRPEDEEIQREGIDTKLAWKIAAIIAGFVLIIGACVAIMYFL